MSRYEQELGKKNSLLFIVIFVVILILLLLWLFLRNQNDIQNEPKVIDIPIERTIPSNSLKEQIMTEENQLDDIAVNQTNMEISKAIKNLKLENSDAIFIQYIGEVSDDLTSWFNVKDSIKKYITLINDLSQNQILYKHRKFLKISQKFIVEKDPQGLYIPEQSYSRYDRLANSIDAIDIQNGLHLYSSFRPLFQQIYNQFSYPADYQLEDIFMKAAASVIEAPVIETRIGLTKETLRYKFADKKLESLNNVQKQMIRMGPENTKKIQNKLRQLVQVLAELNE